VGGGKDVVGFSQIAKMVHDADLENEKFDRKEAIGIDLMLKVPPT
jgi:hypothetical protein